MKKARIPQRLSSHLAPLPNEELKTYAFAFLLKSLYPGGIILNLKKRSDLACAMAISYRTFNKYCGLLRKLEIATLVGNNNQHLQLISTDKICKRFKIAQRCFGHDYIYNSKTLQDLYKEIRLAAVAINLKDQSYIVDPVPTPGKKSVIQKFINPGKVEVNEKRGSDFKVSATKTNDGTKNPVITLSRQSIARVINKKSHSTGSRLMKFGRKIGRVFEKVQKPKVIHNDVDKDFFYNYLSTCPKMKVYFNPADRTIYQRLPKIIKVDFNRSGKLIPGQHISSATVK